MKTKIDTTFFNATMLAVQKIMKKQGWESIKFAYEGKGKNKLFYMGECPKLVNVITKEELERKFNKTMDICFVIYTKGKRVYASFTDIKNPNHEELIRDLTDYVISYGTKKEKNIIFTKGIGEGLEGWMSLFKSEDA